MPGCVCGAARLSAARCGVGWHGAGQAHHNTLTLAHGALSSQRRWRTAMAEGAAASERSRQELSTADPAPGSAARKQEGFQRLAQPGRQLASSSAVVPQTANLEEDLEVDGERPQPQRTRPRRVVVDEDDADDAGAGRPMSGSADGGGSASDSDGSMPLAQLALTRNGGTAAAADAPPEAVVPQAKVEYKRLYKVPDELKSDWDANAKSYGFSARQGETYRINKINWRWPASWTETGHMNGPIVATCFSFKYKSRVNSWEFVMPHKTTSDGGQILIPLTSDEVAALSEANKLTSAEVAKLMRVRLNPTRKQSIGHGGARPLDAPTRALVPQAPAAMAPSPPPDAAGLLAITLKLEQIGAQFILQLDSWDVQADIDGVIARKGQTYRVPHAGSYAETCDVTCLGFSTLTRHYIGKLNLQAAAAASFASMPLEFCKRYMKADFCVTVSDVHCAVKRAREAELAAACGRAVEAAAAVASTEAAAANASANTAEAERATSEAAADAAAAETEAISRAKQRMEAAAGAINDCKAGLAAVAVAAQLALSGGDWALVKAKADAAAAVQVALNAADAEALSALAELESAQAAARAAAARNQAKQAVGASMRAAGERKVAEANMTRPNAFYLVRHPTDDLSPADFEKTFADLPLDVRDSIKPRGGWFVVGFGVSRFLLQPYANRQTRLTAEFFHAGVERDVYRFTQSDNVMFCAEPAPGSADAATLERRLKALLKFSGMQLRSAATLRAHMSSIALFHHPACRRFALPGWADETMLMSRSLWKELWDEQPAPAPNQQGTGAYLRLQCDFASLSEKLLPSSLWALFEESSPYLAQMLRIDADAAVAAAAAADAAAPGGGSVAPATAEAAPPLQPQAASAEGGGGGSGQKRAGEGSGGSADHGGPQKRLRAD